MVDIIYKSDERNSAPIVLKAETFRQTQRLSAATLVKCKAGVVENMIAANMKKACQCRGL